MRQCSWTYFTGLAERFSTGDRLLRFPGDGAPRIVGRQCINGIHPVNRQGLWTICRRLRVPLMTQIVLLNRVMRVKQEGIS
ncbi:MAG: hypothetical protein MK110_04240 [Fuerstiella sp.]|nr:hypothetical protein [Fuerstiella sp.]